MSASLKSMFAYGAIAAAVCIFMQPAQAVVLTANTSTPLPGTTSAAEPNLAGLVLADVVTPFSFSAYGGNVSGTVQSRVVREDVSGTLDFYWRVISDASSAGNIGSFRLGNFVTPVYDANYRIDGLGDTAPKSAYLFDAPYVGFVNYEFTDSGRGGITPGGSSYFMFLHTDATNYASSAFYDLTNVGQTQISSEFSTFAPAAVPEPQSLALMMAGLAVVGAVVRRRR